MKRILLFIALIGFTAVGGYAQNKDCVCKKKVAVHKAVHHTVAVCPEPQAVKEVHRAVSTTVVINNPNVRCYRKDNNMPETCPGVNANTENTFTGNYPETWYNVESAGSYKDLIVRSSAFGNYGVIPAKYTCEGEHASPPLSISAIPVGTKSLALIMYDPHATTSHGTTYWMIWNIDTAGFIPENFVNDNEALNASKLYGYEPICPASGTHFYHFMVYALDTKLVAGSKTNKAMLERVMKGHILGKGELIGVYNRLLD